MKKSVLVIAVLLALAGFTAMPMNAYAGEPKQGGEAGQSENQEEQEGQKAQETQEIQNGGNYGQNDSEGTGTHNYEFEGIQENEQTDIDEPPIPTGEKRAVSDEPEAKSAPAVKRAVTQVAPKVEKASVEEPEEPEAEEIEEAEVAEMADAAAKNTENADDAEDTETSVDGKLSSDAINLIAHLLTAIVVVSGVGVAFLVNAKKSL